MPLKRPGNFWELGANARIVGGLPLFGATKTRNDGTGSPGIKETADECLTFRFTREERLKRGISIAAIECTAVRPAANVRAAFDVSDGELFDAQVNNRESFANSICRPLVESN